MTHSLGVVYGAVVDDRRTLSVQLSEESFDGWQQITAILGVSLTSILEVMGRAYSSGPMPELERYMASDEYQRLVVAAARQLTAERRRRVRT